MSKKRALCKVEVYFWRLVSRFVDRHSDFGRIVNSRLSNGASNWHDLRARLPRVRVIFECFPPETDCLFLGSSHTRYGIVPTEWKTLRAWSAGFSGGDLKMSYYTYQALRKKWAGDPRRQCVVLNDDFFMRSNTCELSSIFHYTLLLTPFTDYAFENTVRLRPYLRCMKKCWAVSCKEGLSEPLVKSCGYIRIHFDPVYTEANGIAVARRHLKIHSFGAKQLVWLERLKAAVAEDGRKFVFLRYPVRSEYAAVIDEEAAKGNDVWESYKPYYEGAVHLDYFRLPMEEGMIWDANHLSEVGARNFTRLLESEFIKLINA